MTPKQKIEALIKTGLSKAEIARALKVCWQTVNHWHFGRFLPSARAEVALNRYFKRKTK